MKVFDTVQLQPSISFLSFYSATETCLSFLKRRVQNRASRYHYASR
ncbi:hypothetical protein MtrunA17_Chr8g0377791 [Medicago truncatula]|uniref:Uncharacterized protein n=1 Tax=Medicago truncatula TaxID=3880 RepID=A0A396GSN7_MEDTR|nr:hypothetical protein MtrunA17_Chr8g0377791 [Medicago truncatula]